MTDNKNKPSLTFVRKQFQIWRANRKKINEPIPDELWKAAGSLVDHYKISDITKTLRLKSNDFKKNIARLKSDIKNELEFVELTPIPVHNSYSQCNIEIEKPNGSKIKISINGMNSVDIVKITRTLWRDS
ncbi:MAG: hypothetical protein OMM_10282 [Candidatus Magnetoglobus multicellularis str. Araruama]|uniref:Uncharacterized protein n=1 Tax=Candidatus Magnetoglobus multicellularis str. Araruama TaxID=890399 RepID=A0A1V1P1Q4_9BACT|nr:MAG: hypothetical protein OMM_10282 [Candidatus Magnetoglobus multicellularis str. Araruama]